MNDRVEAEYIRAVDLAAAKGDNDAALELMTGLEQYWSLFGPPLEQEAS